MTRVPAFPGLMAALLLPVLAPWASAHEGETHAEPPPGPVASGSLPRGETASDLFEVVAVLQPAALVLYVDRYATNAPVAGARVAIDGSGLQGRAQETGEGAYVLPVGTLAPGTHDLTISVEAADNADLLTLSLVVPTAGATVDGAQGAAGVVGWAGGAILLLALIAAALAARHYGVTRREGGA